MTGGAQISCTVAAAGVSVMHAECGLVIKRLQFASQFHTMPAGFVDLVEDLEETERRLLRLKNQTAALADGKELPL